MFKYAWKSFDPKLGLYNMLGVLLVLNLAELLGAAWIAAGVGALLAWITVLLGRARSWQGELVGLLVYLVAGAILSYLAHAVVSNEALRLGIMFLVTFLGMMLMTRGMHAFMVAWCLVYWFLLSPLFSTGMGLEETVNGHLMGVGVVILLHLAKRLWWRPVIGETSTQDADLPPFRFVAVYSAVVALTMVIGLGIGARTLRTDPTLIANSAFNIISPSASQTWKSAVERMLFGTAGICLGFYLGMLFPGALAGQLVIGISSFLALALLRVSFGPMVGALFIMISYQWGTMEPEAGHAIANEKIIAELVGVVLAGIAISTLSMLRQLRHRLTTNSKTDTKVN